MAIYGGTTDIRRSIIQGQILLTGDMLQHTKCSRHNLRSNIISS